MNILILDFGDTKVRNWKTVEAERTKSPSGSPSGKELTPKA